MESEKTYLSADNFLRDAWRLAAAIKASGWKPDLLIALWRGGAFPGVAIHEYFKATGWNVEHLPLKSSCYTGIDTLASEVVFTLGDEVFSRLTPGQKVLVVDDVFDTGLTAQAVKARIDATGAEMKLACVYWKAARNRTALTPDFYTRETGDDWIVFPHEMEGLTSDEIKQKDSVLHDLI